MWRGRCFTSSQERLVIDRALRLQCYLVATRHAFVMNYRIARTGIARIRAKTKNMGFEMFRYLTPTAVLATLCFSPTVFSADFEVFKFAEFGLNATDNLGQTEDNQIEEFVGTVKPSVELSITGIRFDTEVLAEVEFYQFIQEEFNVIDPRIAVETEGTLIDNLLFLNSSLNVGKLLPEEEFFRLTEDSEAIGRFRFNPFLSRQLGRFADLFIAYGHQSTDSNLDADIDQQQDTLQFSLQRDPKLGGFLWGVGANYDRDDNDVAVTESDAYFGSLGATLGQSVFFKVTGGRETNDFFSLAGIEDSGEFLEANLTWTPSELTTVQVGYEDRFFGEGPTFSLMHRVRNSIFSANWGRGITQADPTLSAISPFEGDQTDIVPTIDSPDLSSDDTGLRTQTDPFTETRLSLSYKIAGRRSDLVFDALFSNRDQLGGDNTIDSILGRIVFDRQLSALTTLRIQYDYESSDSDLALFDFEENRIGFKFIYNFDKKERPSVLSEKANAR